MPAISQDEHTVDTLRTVVARAVAEGDPNCRKPAHAAALDRVEDAVFLLDTKGNVCALNRTAAETDGRSPDGVRGKPFWDMFVVPGEQDSFRAMVAVVTETAAPCQFDGHLRTAEGDVSEANWVLREVCNSAGVVQQVLLLARLRTPRPELTGAELRRYPRREFRYRQSIAPWDGGKLPVSTDFFEVQCVDISEGGLSFFVTVRPFYEKFVIALGKPPHVTHFTADLRWLEESELNGRKGVRIGCQFTGRVAL